ncbi:hypothetical protein JCM21142_31075 [Saccharicrinis fermentans DSM 9555 = JCM 21142]|uniref:Uncharacterized protein n=2 Tax=Saccharicrinis fermentans TaxID=982 RepID=W7XW02_9BACT|nr:hypothetical protein JCM21142_31075 [Saccharicrinis fermentans DSM 9555 = JCM 21142]
MKKKKYNIANSIGISLAFMITVFTVSRISNELSYDKFHTQYKSIYRIICDKNEDKDGEFSCRISTKYNQPLYDKFTDIQSITKIIPAQHLILISGDEKFYPTKVFKTSHSFFKMFDFPIIYGSKQNLFDNAREAAISRSAAKKYFGTENVTGKTLQIKTQWQQEPITYQIMAILEDFPTNSHFKAEILLSYPEEEIKTEDNFAYTYLLLKKNCKIDHFSSALNHYWEEKTRANETKPNFLLQPLQDIHLKSNLWDELEQNGSINTLFVLLCGAIVVFLTALINSSNLNYIRFTIDHKEYTIRKINGASFFNIAKIVIKKSLYQTSTAIIIGTIIICYISYSTPYSFLFSSPIKWITISALGFYLLYAAISFLPLLSEKVKKNFYGEPTYGTQKFIYPTIFQIALSSSAIIFSIIIFQQIKLIGNLHPGKEKESIIIIPNVPYKAIGRYETFKSNLLQHSVIRNVSGSLLEPGAILAFNCPYSLDGAPCDPTKKINLLSIDKDFFLLFDIQPIAGTLDMGTTSCYEWENIAIKANNVQTKNIEYVKILEKYNQEHGRHIEKYVINKEALKLFNIQQAIDAIGKQLKPEFIAPYLLPKGEIIGVIDDLHYQNIFSKEQPIVLTAKKIMNSTFIIKIDPHRKKEALQVIKKEWSKINTEYPIDYQFLPDLYYKMYRNEYQEKNAIMIFSCISILISSIGMYTLSSYSTLRKTKEVGIRKVNGADSYQIIVLLLKEYTKWIFIALIIAIPISYLWAIQWLQNFAYKTTLNGWIFALAGVITLAIALLTVSWQSWRAATKNPVEALRYE